MKWYENGEIVFCVCLAAVISVIAVCVATTTIVKHLYPNGLQ